MCSRVIFFYREVALIVLAGISKWCRQLIWLFCMDENLERYGMKLPDG